MRRRKNSKNNNTKTKHNDEKKEEEKGLIRKTKGRRKDKLMRRIRLIFRRVIRRLRIRTIIIRGRKIRTMRRRRIMLIIVMLI